MTDGQTKLDPPWRQAVANFLATDPQPGDVVSRDVLEQWLDLKRPTKGTWEQFRNHELTFLFMRDKWQDELLHKHQIQFSAKDKEGWRVLAPGEVASFTRKRSNSDMRKALRKQRDRLANTDLSSCTPEEQREHAETMVRCSWKSRALREVERRPVELPAPPKRLPKRTKD